MTFRALDSITPANLPAGADVYLAYANGFWPTAAAVRAKFPRARVLVLAVSAGHPDADGCDCEKGDLTVAQVPADVRMRLGRGVWRPVVYCPASWTADVIATLARAGIGRGQVRLLSAHYGRGKHICGPAVCGYPAADGTQWRDNAPGAHGSLIDESVLGAGFFTRQAPVVAPPAPAPAPAPEDDDDMQPFILFDLTTHAGRTPVAVPNGMKRIRLFANEPATFDVDLMDGKPMTRIVLGYGQRAQGAELAADCAVVHRVDDGTNAVSCVLTR